MSREVRLHFSDDIKKCWIVKRDSCGDEYIALNGKNALGKGGLDHIYLITKKQAGLWMTSRQLRQKMNALRSKVSSLAIEQVGDGEAVVSVPISDLHTLCKAYGTRKRKHLSESQLRQLQAISPFFRRTKGLVKTIPDASKITKLR